MTNDSELFLSMMFRTKIKIDKEFFKNNASRHDVLFLTALKCCIRSAPDNRINVSEICRYTGFPKSAASKILNTLEEKELITRFQSTDDRRVVYISISEKGNRYLDEVKTDFNRLSTKICEGLGKENTDKLMELLSMVVDIIDEPYNR